MSYRLAKWLFPKKRPDQSLKLLNTIILVAVVTVGAAVVMLVLMLTQYNQTGR